MAFLKCDSFDHSGAGTSVHASKYDNSNLTAGLSTTFKRTGTHSLALSTLDFVQDSYTTAPTVASGSTAVVGFAMYLPNIREDGDTAFISIMEGISIFHVTVSLTPASTGHMKFRVYRGTPSTGTMLGESSYEIADNSWYYIEFKTTIHDTTGSYELRVDTVDRLSDTNVDTRNSGTGVFDTFRLSGALTGSSSTYYDDLYILDGSGASMNDFLGPQTVEWLVAETGDGANADWTPSSGTDNGAMVDESTPDDDSTYNESDTTGQIDTYHITDSSVVGTIRAVQSVLRVRKTDTSARTIKTVINSGGTNYEMTEQEVLTTYSYILEPMSEDPDTTVAWTGAGVDAMQTGPKVES